MDNKGFVVLSKFAIAARKGIGTINPAKMINDANYRTEVFNKVYQLGDEELMLLSLDLQSALGLLTTTQSAKSSDSEKKYMFGARS